MFVEKVRGIGHIEYVISSDADFHFQRVTRNDCRDGEVGSGRKVPLIVNV
jgi:hypothetical protein